jgi:hypothetical protein
MASAEALLLVRYVFSCRLNDIARRNQTCRLITKYLTNSPGTVNLLQMYKMMSKFM